MFRTTSADAFEGSLSIDAVRFATIIRRDTTVDFGGPLCGDLRRCKFSMRQALFKDIGQVCPVFRRQCQGLLRNLFTSRHDTILTSGHLISVSEYSRRSFHRDGAGLSHAECIRFRNVDGAASCREATRPP